MLPVIHRRTNSCYCPVVLLLSRVTLRSKQFAQKLQKNVHSMHPIQFALQSLFTQNPTTTKSNINLIPCCDEASRSTKPFMTNNANACTLLALPHRCQCQSMWISHQTNRKKLTERNSYKYPTTIKLRIRLIFLSPFLELFIKVKRTRMIIKHL